MVKIGDDIVSTAAHCILTVYSDLSVQQGKSGGHSQMPEKWTSFGAEYFVSDQISLSFAEAKKSAMKVVGYSTNNYYLEGDGVVLGLETPTEGANNWFSDIEALKLAESKPEKGQNVRVSGHTLVDGAIELVSATGVVLGELSPSTFGHAYFDNLTMVGINLDSEQSAYACNFGESGSTLVTESGEAFGALAYVGQSESPNLTQPNVTPDVNKELELEQMLDVKLLGKNYVLCGYSSTSNLEPSPLTVTFGLSTGGK